MTTLTESTTALQSGPGVAQRNRRRSLCECPVGGRSRRREWCRYSDSDVGFRVVVAADRVRRHGPAGFHARLDCGSQCDLGVHGIHQTPGYQAESSGGRWRIYRILGCVVLVVGGVVCIGLAS